jgi:hypothetical protein
VEAKTSHVFEAIVYVRHYVIGIHKFVSSGYSAGWIVESSNFLISLQMKSSISASDR